MKKLLIVSLLLIGLSGAVYWFVIYGGIESGITAIASLTFLICALFSDSTTGTLKMYQKGGAGTTDYHAEGKNISANNKRKKAETRRELISH